ncbi:MAG: HlyD family efflux transporter periplasmic adaptor subunit [Planctomycetes bacterium]|nr:HlyD family efflux transporter periplasmic adaptor subunit [Planctomycetota bacterium]
MKRLLGVGLIAGMAVAAYVFRAELTRWIRPQSEPPVSDPAPAASGAAPERESVWALGRVAPADGLVDLHGTPGDRLVDLLVVKGQSVDVGSPLGRFESELLRAAERDLLKEQRREARDRLEAETETARAKLASARLLVEQARETAALGERVIERRIEALEAVVEQSERDVERTTVLVRDAPQLVSMRELEQQQLLLRKAQAELAAAEAERESERVAADYRRRVAESQYGEAELAVAQVMKSDPLDSLELQEREADERWKRSTFRSPVGGQVVRVFAKAGERIGQRPLLQVADLSRMVCVAEVAFDQVGRIEVGHEARVHSRAFGDGGKPVPLRGKVVEVGALAATPELRQIDPFAATDRHTFEVRVELAAEDCAKAARFVNLQVDVQFLVGKPASMAP